MARGEAFAVLTALVAAGCGGRNQDVYGCRGAVVVITVTPAIAASDAGLDADAGSSTDGGGGDAKPPCTTAACGDYLESLRLGIEGATAADCEPLPRSTELACAPNGNSPFNCPDDTLDTTRALETQIRNYLAGFWPEIDPAAVVFDDCPCHVN